MIFQFLLLFAVLFLISYSHVPFEVFLPVCGAACLCLYFLAHNKKHVHGAFLSIDAQAQKSGLNHWHTGWKMFLALFYVFACVASDIAAVPVFVFFAMSFLTVGLGRISLSYYISLLSVPFIFILLSCLAIMVDISAEPAGLLNLPLGRWYLCVSGASQALALKAMLRSMGAVSCLYMLSLSTPIYRIIAALRGLKVPAVAIELMYLIYRYLFILMEAHQYMIYAAASRLGYCDYRTSMKTMLKNALNLLFISFRQTSDMFTAMEARCYDGEIKFLHKTFPASRRQIIVSFIMAAGVLFAWTWGTGVI